MEADDPDSAAGAQARRRDPQQVPQAAQFVVDQHSQGLERSGSRMQLALIPCGFLSPSPAGEPLGLENDPHQLGGALDRPDAPLLSDQSGNVLGVGLVGQLAQRESQILLGHPGQPVRRGAPDPIVHSHVQRAFLLIAETARRIVDLHARDAQVGEDDVVTVKLLSRQDLADAGKVAAVVTDDVRGSGLSQTLPGPLHLPSIDVESDQSPTRRDSLEERQRVPTVAERTIGHDLAGHRPQAGDHLVHEHGHVSAGRRVPASPYAVLDIRIGMRVEFLVAMLISLRVRAGIARASAMGASLCGLVVVFGWHGVRDPGGME